MYRKHRHCCLLVPPQDGVLLLLLLFLSCCSRPVSPLVVLLTSPRGNIRHRSKPKSVRFFSIKDVLLEPHKNAPIPTLRDQGDDTNAPSDPAERHTRFAGVGRIYARESRKNATELDPHLEIVERLHRATVAVIGLGGVGSWAAEALCRSGIGNIILIDLDDICISNTNRQLHAVSSAVGRMKIDEMKRRLLDINPDCNVTNIYDFVTADNVNPLLDAMLPKFDVCLDAIDGAKEKTALIAACTEKGIPIVTCGGAAGKQDPTQVEVDDLTSVTTDRLLATCRKNLRRRYGYERGLSFAQQKASSSGKRVRKWRISAVYSTELTKALPDGSDASSFRRCDGALGTACFVTGTFGFAAAGRVVEMIATETLTPPRRK